MRNQMFAKFSIFFLFLGICFLTLSSPFAIRAQNNTNSCDWKWVTENEWQWENRYNPVTDKIEPQQVLREVQKYKYVCGVAPITVPNSVPVKVPSSSGSSTTGKYSAPSDSPMLGTWKYEGGCKNIGTAAYPVITCDQISSFVYSQDGTVQSIHIINLQSQVVYENWKYTAEDEKTGVLEIFKDDKLVEKSNVKFLGKTELQLTITLSQSPGIEGKTFILNKK